MSIAETTAVIEVMNADFGKDVEYDELLDESDVQDYEKRLEGYTSAHAEAEAGLQDLSAG